MTKPGPASHRFSRTLTGLACIVILSGCVSPESRPPVPLQETERFSPAGHEPVADRWWTAFNDADLNERIERALEDNFSLALAWERLREADAVVRRERSGLRPSLDETAGAELREGNDVDQESELSLGLEASYEIDLWGRIRSAVEAERLRADATLADYQTAAITLTSELTLAWYQLAESRSQLLLISSQLETNETVLLVLEKRFAVGQSGSADVLRQRQLVESTREQLIIAEAETALLEHRLAVLEGRAPQDLHSFGDAELPELPSMPATGLPSDLLQRRPDIRSAMLLLEAADKDLASAVSDQYPRLNLSASISTSAENPSGLFENWIASLAGQIVAPIIDGGQRRAEVRRNEAVRRQRLAEYGQAVLTAFREVEDALAQEEHETRRIRSLQRQLEFARSTSKQLRTQYLNGATDYIDVLTAVRDQQQLERSVLGSRLNLITSRIALYRALAGGFETPREVAEHIQPEQTDEQPTGDSTRG